jgi:RNA polymerase sigma-70 factor (ECF subfamily)
MSDRADGAARWLPAARAGSQEAVGRALEACRGYLLLIANRELGADLQPKGAPSDLVQETFLQAHRDFGQFRGDSDEELLAWLRCLLQHRLANFARGFRGTQKRGLGREVALGTDSAAAPPTPEDTPSVQMMAREQAEAVEQALARLPKDYRRVILLRYQENRTFEEIGALLGRSAEAARKLWWRALERVQEDLQPPT